MSANGFDAAEVERIMSAQIERARAFYGEDAGGAAPLLPILHALQHAFGHVPPDANALIAKRLNISQAEVRGVVSFYTDFRTAPGARRVIKLCRAEACQARGCERIAAHLESAHGLIADAPSREGEIELETVYCLGNCALGPAALVGDELVGLIDEARADALVAEALR
ncbi:MAG: NAD(P)H-dependent oxidoreductase subunit E [Beijerinckiaceae bacterium]|nr:NAD(P)H-dependent oxidoreductase subunit E [Beijerinckiaceae bacterium]